MNFCAKHIHLKCQRWIPVQNTSTWNVIVVSTTEQIKPTNIHTMNNNTSNQYTNSWETIMHEIQQFQSNKANIMNNQDYLEMIVAFYPNLTWTKLQRNWMKVRKCIWKTSKYWLPFTRKTKHYQLLSNIMLEEISYWKLWLFLVMGQMKCVLKWTMKWKHGNKISVSWWHKYWRAFKMWTILSEIQRNTEREFTAFFFFLTF